MGYEGGICLAKTTPGHGKPQVLDFHRSLTLGEVHKLLCTDLGRVVLNCHCHEASYGGVMLHNVSVPATLALLQR